MRFPPPEAVASWPPPNYVDPQTRGPALIIVVIALFSVVLVCLSLRLYVRLGIMNKSGLDDWLMVVAAILGLGVTTCVLLAVDRHGWDMHVWDLTLDKVIAGRQVSFAAQGLFILGTCFAKVSILVSYLRLAPAQSWFRRITWRPISSYWNLEYSNRDCIDESYTIVTHASLTACADALIWLLPLPSLYRAKLPLAQRLSLMVLFSFGLVVVFAASIRIYLLHYVLDETYDVTWDAYHMWLVTAVEIQLGIICGCVPWLKSLFNFWRSRRTVVDITDKSDGCGRKKDLEASSTARPDDARQTSTTWAAATTTTTTATSTSKSGAVEGIKCIEKGSDGPQEEWVDLERGPYVDPETVGIAL
ncbi:99404ebe-6efa-41a3-8013-c4e2c356624f [Thermothielavioides terrestris]|uniref:99404ebe-6efa-41a3-8013-c4e2c356624f n=1 Tax=Thermothielavioides terrestris TaxID=2587410 RepID=A0A446BNJ5_9PEZI|nr:99404ebe-6efa-41a3-8013-c4e2c356624f [Thermothielavioides terrestris]